MWIRMCAVILGAAVLVGCKDDGQKEKGTGNNNSAGSAARAVNVDLTTPEAAVKSLAKAILAWDVASSRAAATSDATSQQVAEGQARLMAAYREASEAIASAGIGRDVKDVFESAAPGGQLQEFYTLIGTAVVTADTTDEPARVKVEGSHEELAARKVDGHWRIELNKMSSNSVERYQQGVKRYTTVTAAVKSGKAKTRDDVLLAYRDALN